MPTLRNFLFAFAALGAATALASDTSWPDVLAGHGGPVKSVTVQDGQALTASFDYAANLWDLSAPPARVAKRLIGHRAAVNDAAFAGARIITASDDGSVMIWDAESGEALARHETAGEKVMAVAVSPDGAHGASAHWDNTVRIYDLLSTEEVSRLEGHTNNVNDVVFAAGRVFTASSDGTILEWTTDWNRPVSRPLVNQGWGINVLAHIERTDGDWLVFGAQDGTVGAVSLVDKGLTANIARATRPIMSLAVSPEGSRLAVGDGSGSARVYDVEDWTERALITRPGPVWGIAFADEDHLYLTGLDDRAFLWRAVPNAPLATAPETFPRRFQARAGEIGSTGELLGAGVIGRGELQFQRKCSVCHTLTPDDANRAGPTLHGVFGRRIASLPGYPYSEAMRGMDLTWSAETIGLLFEHGPDNFTPGSKMPMQRIVDRTDRDALVAFLREATE